MLNFKRKKNRRLVIMVSGRGKNMESIVKSCQKKNWPIKIVGVIADNNCNAIKLANYLKIENWVVDRKKFDNSGDFDESLSTLLLKLDPTLIALAGFMHILSEKFCKKFDGKIVNIHPSILPNYKGLNTHKRVLESKEKIHGATVHAVNKHLDSGDILCQGIVPILKNDTEKLLANRVLEIETMIYPLAIAAILSSKVLIENGKWKINKPDLDFPDFNFSRKIFHPNFVI